MKGKFGFGKEQEEEWDRELEEELQNMEPKIWDNEEEKESFLNGISKFLPLKKK